MNLAAPFRSTSTRTFLVIPVLLLGAEWLLRREQFQFQLLGMPLMLWGYLQYRLAGNYRTRLGGGGPGIRNPPERLVTSGIFAYTRNPMYLGHMLFLTGLAITLRSYIGAAVLALHLPWYHFRVVRDERRLHELFGEEYAQYIQCVKRWIPYVA